MTQIPFTLSCQRQAVILMGIQASGKSTFYQQILQQTHAHISLDVLRTRGREQRALTQCLAEGKSFIIDNTNPTKEDRQRYIPIAKQHGYHVIGIFFQSIVKDCIRRNERRNKGIMPKAIACTSNKLEMPSRTEGFDEIFFAKMNNDNGFDIEPWIEKN